MNDHEAARTEAQRRADAFDQLMDDVITDIQHRIRDNQQKEHG